MSLAQIFGLAESSPRWKIDSIFLCIRNGFRRRPKYQNCETSQSPFLFVSEPIFARNSYFSASTRVSHFCAAPNQYGEIAMPNAVHRSLPSAMQECLPHLRSRDFGLLLLRDFHLLFFYCDGWSTVAVLLLLACA